MNKETNAQVNKRQKLQTRTEIRQLVRKQRNALTNAEQTLFAEQLSIVLQTRLSNLMNTALDKPSQTKPLNIALYLANDGELNPQPFIDWCWGTKNINVYLPVIHPFSQGNLLFLRYSESTPMIKNKYGIAEPKLNILNMCPVNNLHMLCTPLVAFDNKGNRLGMGGGFYDRTLSNITYSSKTNSTLETTKIIGLAHNCQEVEQLPIEAWDMPLPEIITPEKTFFTLID